MTNQDGPRQGAVWMLIQRDGRCEAATPEGFRGGATRLVLSAVACDMGWRCDSVDDGLDYVRVELSCRECER